MCLSRTSNNFCNFVQTQKKSDKSYASIYYLDKIAETLELEHLRYLYQKIMDTPRFFSDFFTDSDFSIFCQKEKSLEESRVKKITYEWNDVENSFLIQEEKTFTTYKDMLKNDPEENLAHLEKKMRSEVVKEKFKTYMDFFNFSIEYFILECLDQKLSFFKDLKIGDLIYVEKSKQQETKPFVFLGKNLYRNTNPYNDSFLIAPESLKILSDVPVGFWKNCHELKFSVVNLDIDEQRWILDEINKMQFYEMKNREILEKVDEKIIRRATRHDYKLLIKEIDKWGNKYNIEIYYSCFPEKKSKDEFRNVKDNIIYHLKNYEYKATEKMELDFFWPFVQHREEAHDLSKEQEEETLYIIIAYENCNNFY